MLRTVSAIDASSCSRAHWVFILESLRIRSCPVGPFAAPDGCPGRVVDTALMASRRATRSNGPGTRRARGNAFRRSARSRHCGSGCRFAPRPGSRRWGSGTHAPETATTLIRSDRAARSRHPTQMRWGPDVPPVEECTPPITLVGPWRRRAEARALGRCRIGYQCASPSIEPQAARSGPRGRWRARVGSRGRSPGRPAPPDPR